MFTLTPANFVPGDAAALGSVDAGCDAAAEGGGTEAAAAEADGEGLTALLHAVRTRIGMIAAATSRYRDTAESPPLDILRRSFSILNARRYAGQYGERTNKVKI
jgi:hypothetical protein